MKKAYLLSLFMLAVSVLASAQTVVPLQRKDSSWDPSLLMREAGVSAGIQGILRSDRGAEAVFGVDFGRYYRNGMGWRTGLRYAGEYCDIDRFAAVPVAFAWRSRLRSPGEALVRGAEGLSSYRYEQADFMTLMGAFLLNLFNRFELVAGVTPGYVFGGSDIYRHDFRDDACVSFEDEGIRLAHPFYLSADLGFALSYRIWRFNLRFSPAVHYIFTDNFRLYRHFESASARVSEKIDKPLSWAASLDFGLNFMF